MAHSKSDLVQLIEFEINRILREEKLSGWTAKALISALVLLLWVFITKLAQLGQLVPDAIVLLCLWLALAIDAAHATYTYFSPIASYAMDKPRFHPSSYALGHKRLFFLLQIIYYLTLAYVASTTQLIKQEPIKAVILSYLLISFVFASIAFLLSYIPFPFFRNNKSHMSLRNDLVAIFYYGLTLSSAILVTAIVIHDYRTISFSLLDMQIAGMTIACAWLILLLADSASHHLMYPRLVDLRERLVLQDVDDKFAREELSIILHGNDGNEAWQRITDVQIKHLATAKFNINKMAEELKKFRAIYQGTSVDREEKERVIRECRTAIHQFSDRARSECELALNVGKKNAVRMFLYLSGTIDNKKHLLEKYHGEVGGLLHDMQQAMTVCSDEVNAMDENKMMEH